MAELTILMPVFNAAGYISEAIKSILNQSFTEFELWIIDDASMDNTLSIAESFQDPRISIYTNPANEGRVRTINRHVKEISSPFFTITDADDVSHPQRLERQIRLLKSNPTLMMCGTFFWIMDENGFLVRKMVLHSELSHLRNNALYQSQFHGPTTLMRREVIDDFPDFYREYFIDNFADADLACLILDKYPATNLPELLYFYRVGRSSNTRKKITVRSLNIYRLVGHLAGQRRAHGQDCLQRGNWIEADAFVEKIQMEYNRDPSYIFRHLAFFHLYWGLVDLSVKNICKAFLTRPFLPKNSISFAYIIFRIGLFYLNRIANRRHYSGMISCSK